MAEFVKFNKNYFKIQKIMYYMHESKTFKGKKNRKFG